MLQEPFGIFRRNMQNESLRPYREHLRRRKAGLALKRAFDLLTAAVCVALLSPFYLIAAAAVKLTSKGPVFYYQERVGKDARKIRVMKFRTMVVGADRRGQLTVGSDDQRITRVGKILRASNFDEFPQMFNVLKGDMSIVGVRPEVPRYVACYTPEDYATLLLRPGMASITAILYRHENEMLSGSADPEKDYIEKILPEKMKFNREYIRNFSFGSDLIILLKTILCVFQKDQMLGKREQ